MNLAIIFLLSVAFLVVSVAGVFSEHGPIGGPIGSVIRGVCCAFTALVWVFFGISALTSLGKILYQALVHQ